MKFLYGKNHNQTDNFEYIDWSQLCELIKSPLNSTAKNYDEAKRMSRVIAATDALSKRKDDVLEHNRFTMLRLDLDDVAITLDEIKKMLFSKGIHSYVIHSTAKHQQIDKSTGECFGDRYRVYIQLADALSYSDWSIIQQGLEVYFSGDGCANRPQQIMYLPTHFEGINYDYHIQNPEDCPATFNGSPVYKPVGSMIEEWRAIVLGSQQSEHIEPEIKPKAAERPIVGNQISIIDTFNESITWDELLRQFGYKKKGARWLSPESKSGVAGGVILVSSGDGKERYYSHSESEQAIIGTRAIDKFDLLCVREFGGNEHEAIRHVAEAYFPEVDKHNKREYAINKHNEEATQLLEGEE